jgi:hypothetical protein
MFAGINQYILMAVGALILALVIAVSIQTFRLHGVKADLKEANNKIVLFDQAVKHRDAVLAELKEQGTVAEQRVAAAELSAAQVRATVQERIIQVTSAKVPEGLEEQRAFMIKKAGELHKGWKK